MNIHFSFEDVTLLLMFTERFVPGGCHETMRLGCPRDKNGNRAVLWSLFPTTVCVFKERHLSLLTSGAIFPQDIHCFENKRKPHQL